MKAPYQKVIDFYNNTSPKQHQFFLQLISNNITFFNTGSKESFKIDEEYLIDFNGICHQVNIK
tara:strand:- start:950 stop:1138 length:189 start_codon:yes stop_codon:yes gene_type:complete